MPQLRAQLNRLLRDESGGELIEWALVAGLIVIACITLIAAFGARALARWNSVNNGIP